MSHLTLNTDRIPSNNSLGLFRLQGWLPHFLVAIRIYSHPFAVICGVVFPSGRVRGPSLRPPGRAPRRPCPVASRKQPTAHARRPPAAGPPGRSHGVAQGPTSGHTKGSRPAGGGGALCNARRPRQGPADAPQRRWARLARGFSRSACSASPHSAGCGAGRGARARPQSRRPARACQRRPDWFPSFLQRSLEKSPQIACSAKLKALLILR